NRQKQARHERPLRQAHQVLIGENAEHAEVAFYRSQLNGSGTRGVVKRIGVGKQQPRTARLAYALRQRPRLADPTVRKWRPQNDAQGRILGGKTFENTRRRVVRTIVDDHDFEIVVPLRQQGTHALFDLTLLVARRYDDRQRGKRDRNVVRD